MWQAPAELIPTLPALGEEPAGERQIAAILGIGFDGTGLTAEQANLVLSARDYAETIMLASRVNPWHWKECRLRVMNHLLSKPDVHAWLREWAWSQRDRGDEGDPKVIPLDDLYASTAAFLVGLTRQHPRS